MTLEKTLRWIVLTGIFTVPVIALIVSDTLFFPYITGKNFAFRIIVEIIAFAWLALALVIPSYRPRRGWIVGAFALFVLIIAIADAQGVYPFKSFWSNFERMDGWITVAHTFLFFIVSVSMLQTENLWRRFFQWSLCVSAFLSLLGLMQVAGILDLGSGGTGLGGRVDATFGNPIYFAVYMLFQIFIAWLLWAQEGKERWSVQDRLLLPMGSLIGLVLVIQQLLATNPNNTKVIQDTIMAYIFFVIVVGLLMSMRRYWLLAFIVVLDTLALLFSGTRGATLGLIGGAFLALLLFAVSRDASKKFRTMTVAVFVGGLVFAGGLFLARDSALVHNVGFLGRLSSISLSDNTTLARIINIQTAWKGVKERPILGWGQENYAIVFDKYYDPRMYAQEQWFDRVHNIIFDWWVAGGTLGLLSYLSIFGATLYALWRKGFFVPAERAILTGLLAGYFVHNLTVFDNVTSYILFASVLGYISYREQEKTDSLLVYGREFMPRSALPWIAGALAVVAGISVWAINASAIAANHAIIAAITPQSAGLEQNLNYFKTSIAYGSYGTQEAREQLAQGAMRIVSQSGISDTVKLAFVQTAVNELDLQQKQSSLDARFPLFAGAVLDTAGAYKEAAVELERAHELSPNKQTILFEVGVNAQLRGDTAGMLSALKAAYELNTEYNDALFYYAAALIRAGKDDEADKILAPLVEKGQVGDDRIASAYIARKEYGKIVSIWSSYLKKSPSNAQAYFTLAYAYYLSGDKQAAIDKLMVAKTVDGSVGAEVDQYISQIKAGAPLN